MCRLHIWRCRPTVRNKNRFSILQGTVRTYETRCGGLCNCVCCKFPGVCFCQELAKSDDLWQSYNKYNKYKKGDVGQFCWHFSVGLQAFVYRGLESLIDFQRYADQIRSRVNISPVCSPPSVQFSRIITAMTNVLVDAIGPAKQLSFQVATEAGWWWQVTNCCW